MRHFRVSFEPDNTVVEIHSGATLLEAASKAGIILNTICGGKGTCGKCAVVLKDTKRKVLACQYLVESDLTVTIPETSRFDKQQILLHGIERQMHINPCIRKHFLKLDSLKPESVKAKLKHACTDHCCEIDNVLLGRLANDVDLSSNNGGITFVSHLSTIRKNSSHCYRVIAYEKGDTSGKIFGVAIDVGTTTVVAKLIDMIDGKTVATKAMDNPQSVFGADVISRISFGNNQAGLEQMHRAIIAGINQLIEQLCSETAIDANYIYELCIAGNTTMNHIFLGFPVEQLGQMPFSAHTTDSHDIPAAKLGIIINPSANVYTIANIAGFLGADTTAVALAVGMDKTDKITLVIDIGTNGELILGTKDKMYAASCAAGPAFEGARIRQGSRAIDGSIQSVIINHEDIDIDVIGGGVAKSICGSGLIDAMAVLVELGVVDSTGRFVEPEKLQSKLPAKILKRIVQSDGQWAFVLADKVHFTQRDVRETQLAKAAMRVGIVLLQKEMGITDSQIDQILLAGAFGNYISRESAKRIGLIPDLDLAKVHFVGNAASTGAIMALLSVQCRKLADELAGKMHHIELAESPDFSMAYAECMMF
jgi:uncharacterized 2Fe-2S/4Fe-4S cluster protein (DUF4445 family)